MNKVELKMLYKQETSFTAEEVDCFARVGDHGDVILDRYGLDDAFINKIETTRTLVIPDPDYVLWLENKVMETLNHGR